MALIEVETPALNVATGEYYTITLLEDEEAIGASYVPDVISPFQARAALLAAGMLDDVELAIEGSGPEVRIAWEYATEWRRDSPTIAALADALGLSAEDVDNLFIAASEIVA